MILLPVCKHHQWEISLKKLSVPQTLVYRSIRTVKRENIIRFNRHQTTSFFFIKKKKINKKSKKEGNEKQTKIKNDFPKKKKANKQQIGVLKETKVHRIHKFTYIFCKKNIKEFRKK